MSRQRQITLSPVNGSVYVERDYASDSEISTVLDRAWSAGKSWAALPIEERARICHAAVDAFVARRDRHAEELAWQIGRPVSVGGGEVGGFEERARYMIDIAADTQKPSTAERKKGSFAASPVNRWAWCLP